MHPYKRSVTKLDVYVRNDLDRNNTHENLAAFNPEGWTLLKSDLTVKPNPGGAVVDTPSGLLTGEELKGTQARYLAIHVKDVVGGAGDLRYATLGEVQVFGTSTTGFVYVPDNKPKGYLVPEKRDDGIKVSVLCPQGVNTAMAPRSLGDGQTDGVIEPEALARTVIETLREERFHVLPHPEVEEYVRRKGDDIDRWLVGMQRLRRRALGD